MANERPTLATVAAAAGVSAMTVSNAYNRPDQLSAETRQRVLDVAKRLGYAGPNPAAQSLRRGRAGTIGVVLTERLPYAFTDPGLMEILHGLATELSDSGVALLLIPPGPSDEEPMVRHAIVDAFVLCSLTADDPAVAAAVERRLPIVTVGHPQLPGAPRIGIDNAAAAACAADHLAGLGHARFAVLTIEGEPTSDAAHPVRHHGLHERAAGFADRLTALGVPASRVTLCVAAQNTAAAGAAAVAPLISGPSGRRPTAVFAVTDILALGAVDAIRLAGLHVPAEVSVVGFDDVAAAAASEPPLTTVSQSLFAQGRAAARLAKRRIAGERVRAPRIVPQLVVRRSSGPPPRTRRA